MADKVLVIPHPGPLPWGEGDKKKTSADLLARGRTFPHTIVTNKLPNGSESQLERAEYSIELQTPADYFR